MGGGGTVKRVHLEVWDGILADFFIGQQALKLLIRLLAAGKVACICCCTPCAFQVVSTQQQQQHVQDHNPITTLCFDPAEAIWNN